MRYVIALSGNALLRRSQRPDASVQCHHIRLAAAQLAPIAADNEVIICHGTGPQVGVLALESDADRQLSEPFPLDALGAQTQGMIGYWLALELGNAGVAQPIGVLLTQTLVDADDPAFAHPSKFIGPSYTRAEATDLATRRGWHVAPDTAGWRRVVASPEPRALIEIDLIERMAAAGDVVVCGGGGGVPVVRHDGALHGVEAVVDKDLTAALLAIELDADRLVILTDVDTLKTGFGTSDEAILRKVDVEQLEGMSFPPGSMASKIEACRRFVTRTGRPAHVGALDHAGNVVAGRSGTTIGANAVARRARVRDARHPTNAPTRLGAAELVHGRQPVS